MTHKRSKFAICIDNSGYEDDLLPRTIYRVLRDVSAEKSNYLRIIDETGEDYLYPAARFILLPLPRQTEQQLVAVF